MRGKDVHAAAAVATARITPAYAGKSFLVRPRSSRSRDHPRLCGEKGQVKWKKRKSTGSPPPMRGKGITEGEHKKQCRITPAYAGKRDTSTSKYSAILDHPRLCGEKWETGAVKKRAWGSPPPMRGKERRSFSRAATGRITPAYAGKSELRHMLRNCIQDHPRLCGEKYAICIIFQLTMGSPPPMRGKESFLC